MAFQRIFKIIFIKILLKTLKICHHFEFKAYIK